MKIAWAPQARSDRAAIWDFIAQDSLAAAARIDQLFSDIVAKLADFPRLGHPGIVAGTYELSPHKSYRLIYEIVGETVWVLAIVHAARHWPPVR